MALQVVGAGVGRTGTASLRQAIERLTGGTCYHMSEVFGKPDHVDTWKAAAEGSMPDWNVFLAGYSGTLDWPACTCWRELARAYPRGAGAALDPSQHRRLVCEHAAHDHLHRQPADQGR